VVGLADAPAVQHHPVAGAKSGWVELSTTPEKSIPGVSGQTPHHRRAAGQGQAILVVDSREVDANGHVAWHQIVVGEVAKRASWPVSVL